MIAASARPPHQPVIDLSGRQPAWDEGAIRAWAKAHRRASRDRDVWTCPDPRGDLRLRGALADLLGAPAGRLVVTAGIRALAQLLGVAGASAVVERPGFSGISTALRAAGSTVQEGSWAEMLAGRDWPPRGEPGPTTWWLTSPGRNPDGRSLAASEGRALTALLDRGDRVVVNETYRWHCAARPRLPGATTAGTLSKVAGSGSRLGWLVAAHPLDERVVDHVAAMPPALWQRTWAYLIEDGALTEFRHGQVRRLLAARDAFRAAGRSWLAPEVMAAEGPSLLLYFRCRTSRELAVGLRRLGVRAGLGGDFGVTEASVRVSFSAVREPEAATAAHRLRTLHREHCRCLALSRSRTAGWWAPAAVRG